MTEYIGAKISLISRSDIRYVGILHEINSEESTVALEQVRSFGTEGRRGRNEVPPSDNVFEYIVFRGADVKDLKVEEAAKKPEAPLPPAVPDDPAILATSAPPPRTKQPPGYPPMHGYPPPPPGYGYPPPPFGGPSGFRPPPSQHMSPPAGFGYPNYPQGIPPAVFGGPAPAGETQPPQQQQQPQPAKSSTSPPPPVKETKPDIATATAPPPVPPTLKPAPIQANAAKQTITPAMPIPISIPVQARPAKTSPATSPQRPVAETAKVATAADVQSLAKNLSETKLSTTQPSDNTPGAGGYLTHPHGYRRRFHAPPVSANAPNMNQDYDFESANAKFNKEDVAKEVAAAHTSTTTTNGTTTEDAEPAAVPSSASLAAALEGDNDSFYDKGKSFFDNISCENKDRAATTASGEPPATHWKRNEERKLNMETFGQASVDYGGGRYGGRGGGVYGRGRGTGYRGGRGGGGGYRGGYRGTNPWRGGPPRTAATNIPSTNGPNSAAPAATNNSTTA